MNCITMIELVEFKTHEEKSQNSVRYGELPTRSISKTLALHGAMEPIESKYIRQQHEVSGTTGQIWAP